MLTALLALTLAHASPGDVTALSPQMRAELDSLNPVQGKVATDERVLVVDFFASWCGPCRGQLAQLTKLQSEHPKEVQVVAVNVFEDYNGQSSPARLRSFVERADYPFTVIEGTSHTRELFGGVSRIPTVLAFDAKGHTLLTFTHDQPDQVNVSAEELAKLLRPDS